MTCKDCIHYDVCQYHIDEETDMTVTECGRFKNKADYVEVTRCKKCEYWTGEEHYGCCKKHSYAPKHADDFCSGGERRTDDET